MTDPTIYRVECGVGNSDEREHRADYLTGPEPGHLVSKLLKKGYWVAVTKAEHPKLFR